MTIQRLDVLLFQFWIRSLFHVWFKLLLIDLHIDFSGGKASGQVLPSPEEVSTVFVIHTVKGFSKINKAEIDVFFFLEFSCCFDDPVGVGNLISDSSAFSESSLNIWKFTVHLLLKHGMGTFEHYFASMWDEFSCVVVGTIFDIVFLWIGMKTDIF